MPRSIVHVIQLLFLAIYTLNAIPVAPLAIVQHFGRVPVPDSPNYVFRALSAQDLIRVQSGKSIMSSQRYGIPLSNSQKVCPNGGSDCAICHVALGEKSTEFISTSKSLEEASYYDKRGIVRIDLNKLDPSSVFDLTNVDVRKKMIQNKATNDAAHRKNAELAETFAYCNKEVLVLGEIPILAYELVSDEITGFLDMFPFTSRSLN